MKKYIMITAVCSLMTGAAFTSTAMADNHGHYGDTAKAETINSADIVDTALTNENFSTLVSALQAADLVDALKGDGPFTVFAPTNDAFASLPEGTLENLVLEENKEKLQSILTFHVVPGKIKSTDINEGSTDVTTLQGSTLEVVKSSGGVTVNGANVTSADIQTSNGVIHVIDAVVMPE